ncbi:DUF4174 domain-containing protein [Aliigemmobacter aestuarii]|uniref:DUF4174 domain-containing protein n=1 Tax=Aliigemmobacter aestuarii TaxID=1445661 RepID=A0A4S3MKU2_9RHOB|nr:DUF4174 domain-containing protein [Gemmobacter aestuarii]THD82170.1 DUF4174 domain-containing protein [Gemmobacter aestuarii]
MKPLYILVLSAFLPLATMAEDSPAFAPVPGSEVVLEDLMYLKRPVVVFADSPNDPNFTRQLALLERDFAGLEARDVVLIVDTDPAAKSAIRQKLRPRGFSLVLMDKDLKPVIRKPLPWDVREIVAAIDKFPLRRQEMLERLPAGR